VKHSIATATIGAAFLNPLTMRDNSTVSYAFIIFTASTGEVPRTSAKASKDAGPTIFTAVTTLLGTSCEADERQDGCVFVVLSAAGGRIHVVELIQVTGVLTFLLR